VFVQHFCDRVLASAAIPFDPASGIDVVGSFGAAGNGSADAEFIEPIADADDHPSQVRRRREYVAQLRMIVNRGQATKALERPGHPDIVSASLARDLYCPKCSAAK
jgi:hypothetical protein